jgi:hypothetical protein
VALISCAFTLVVGQSANSFSFPAFVSGRIPFAHSERAVGHQITNTGFDAFFTRVVTFSLNEIAIDIHSVAPVSDVLRVLVAPMLSVGGV